MPRDLIATYPAIPLLNDISLESFYLLSATLFIIFIMKMTCVQGEGDAVHECEPWSVEEVKGIKGQLPDWFPPSTVSSGAQTHVETCMANGSTG